MLIISQFAIIILLLCLTLANEIIDVPHYLFNDAPTLYSQRIGSVLKKEQNPFSVIFVDGL